MITKKNRYGVKLNLLIQFVFIQETEHKVFEWIITTVKIDILSTVYRKVQWLDLYYLISTWLTCSMNMRTCREYLQDTCGGYVFCAYRISKNYQFFFRCYETIMKTNPGKSHVLLSCSTQKLISFENVPVTSTLGKKCCD